MPKGLLSWIKVISASVIVFFAGLFFLNLFTQALQNGFATITSNRADFVILLQSAVTVMALIISFSGLAFIETNKNLIESAEPLRRSFSDANNLRDETETEKYEIEKKLQAEKEGKDKLEERRNLLDETLKRLSNLDNRNERLLSGYLRIKRKELAVFILALVGASISIVLALYLMVESPDLLLFQGCIFSAFSGVVGFASLIILFSLQSSFNLENIRAA